jgi:hypothetical protein
VIRKVSTALDALLASGLNQKAIVLLVADASGVGKRDVTRVLQRLKSLAATYTTPREEAV